MLLIRYRSEIARLRHLLAARSIEIEQLKRSLRRWNPSAARDPAFSDPDVTSTCTCNCILFWAIWATLIKGEGASGHLSEADGGSIPGLSATDSLVEGAAGDRVKAGSMVAKSVEDEIQLGEGRREVVTAFDASSSTAIPSSTLRRQPIDRLGIWSTATYLLNFAQQQEWRRS